MQILWWVNPGGDGIAEEYKVCYHASWIHRDHMTHSTEG